MVSAVGGVTLMLCDACMYLERFRGRGKAMVTSGRQGGLVLKLSLVVLALQVFAIGGPRPVGRVASTAGVSMLNGIELVAEATVFPGDLVTTDAESTAVIYFPNGGKVHLGPEGSMRVAEEDGATVMHLDQGGLASQHLSERLLAVQVAGIRVRPVAASDFQVAREDNFVYVVAGASDVELKGRTRTVVARAGRVLKVEVAPTDNSREEAGTGAEAEVLPGRILRSIGLGDAENGRKIAPLKFVFSRIKDCDTAISPRDPDCGSGYAAN